MSAASQSLSHARWHGKSHGVCVPKRRRKAMFGHLRQALGPLLHALARQKACRIMEEPLMPDQVHRWIEIPPQDAVASGIGQRKGQSALAIARQCAGQDRHGAGEHVWARGYAVSTVGFALEQVRAYSRAQEDANGEGRFERVNRSRPPLRRSRSSSHRLCRGCLTLSVFVCRSAN